MVKQITVPGLELLSAILGEPIPYSPTATIHAMLRRANPGLGMPGPEPELKPKWSDSAYTSPGYAWTRGLTPSEKKKGWVRAFDRSGSFLSAWSSCGLPVGTWRYQHIPAWFPQAQEGRTRPDQPGYYLIYGDAYASSVRVRKPRFTSGLPNPITRAAGTAARIWITAPLLQLITEHQPTYVLGSWTTDGSVRALDTVASILSAVRRSLLPWPPEPTPPTFGGRELDAGPAQEALAALKDGYAGASAWFEFAHRDSTGFPLHPTPLIPRPAWRRTIIDRFVANTWRSLAKASPRPFALTGVDTALFAVSDPDEAPEGLRMGLELGAWKPKGEAIPPGYTSLPAMLKAMGA